MYSFIIVIFGVFCSFHPVFDARRNQLQHEPSDHGDGHHRNQGCGLKNRSGFCASGGDPGENTFKDPHKQLGDSVESIYKGVFGVCSQQFENQAVISSIAYTSD